MFGFVAYQLWGTGIEYARAQDRAEDHFNDLLDRLSTTSSTTTSTTSTTSTTTATTLAPGVTTVPGSVVATTPSTTSTTTTSTTTTTSPPGTTIPDFSATIEGMRITEGDPMGFIDFKKLEQGMYIFPGVSRADLENGPGHFPETPMPGQLGNAAIAGHRTTWGEPFRHLDKLDVGDEIVVTMPYGVFTYIVTSIEIVDPSDREVIATTDPDIATLTLATCHPAFSARQRLIIHAELDLELSSAPGVPVINYGRDTPIPTDVGLPGEDVDDPTTTPAPTTTLAPTTTAVDPTTTFAGQTTVAASSTLAAVTTPTTAVVAPPTTTDPIYSVNPGGGSTGGPTDGLGSDDEAFSNRWFSDEEAFPQVTLWAGSCAAIVVAAYQLAKRFRNLPMGLALGILPFVVGLYFFYENVNRLLPAAL